MEREACGDWKIGAYGNCLHFNESFCRYFSHGCLQVDIFSGTLSLLKIRQLLTWSWHLFGLLKWDSFMAQQSVKIIILFKYAAYFSHANWKYLFGVFLDMLYDIQKELIKITGISLNYCEATIYLLFATKFIVSDWQVLSIFYMMNEINILCN